MAPSDPAAAPPPPAPAWATPPGGSPQVRYGGFWLRVVAYLIDAIVVDVVLVLLSAVTGLRLIAWRVAQHQPRTFSIAFNDYGFELLCAT